MTALPIQPRNDVYNRRTTLLVGAAAAVAGMGMGGTANCTMPANVVTDIASLIQRVQAGVAQLCVAVGKTVPTVDTVLLVIESFLGASLTTSNLATGITFIQKAIDAIAAVGCPSGGPPTTTASPTASVNGKSIPIEFF